MDEKSKNNKGEKRLLDSSKVKDMPQMNSSSDLSGGGFSNAVAEAKEKMGGKKSPTASSGGIFGCFFCCGPKQSVSASSNRKRTTIPRPEKRRDLLTSPTTDDPD